jgi:hypothetical protein
MPVLTRNQTKSNLTAISEFCHIYDTYKYNSAAYFEKISMIQSQHYSNQIHDPLITIEITNFYNYLYETFCKLYVLHHAIYDFPIVKEKYNKIIHLMKVSIEKLNEFKPKINNSEFLTDEIVRKFNSTMKNIKSLAKIMGIREK